MSDEEKRDMGRRRQRRKLLIPEVIQTSTTDCGPASLKSILGGFGLDVGYEALRELCQTDLDGTSIDSLEEILHRLGLGAEQAIVPVEHLLLDEAQLLPAIVVVKSPIGEAHFVTVWRRHGPLLQIMDPNSGRAWPSREQFLKDLYLHEMPVDAEAWREWAGDVEFRAPLERRLRALRLPRRECQRLLADALGRSEWRPLAALDAAVRVVETLAGAESLRRGSESLRAVERLYTQALQPSGEALIPSRFWSAVPAEPSEDGSPRVALRGAVVLRIQGPAPERHADAAHEPDSPPREASPEIERALTERPVALGRALLGFLKEDGPWRPVLLLGALLLISAGVTLETLLLRGLLEVLEQIRLGTQRLGSLVALATFCASLLALEAPVVAGVLWLGRRLETRFRVAFLHKLPRLTDRYLQSRLTSDLAHRSHLVHRLRLLPDLGRRVLQSCFELGFTVLAIAWLSPALWPWAALAAVCAVVLPAVFQPVMRERDLRVQTLASNLSRFFLDGLQGLVATRAHGAERSLRHEQRLLMRDWVRAQYALQGTIMATEGLQSFIGYGFAALLVLWHLQQGPQAIGGALLLAYLALNLPRLGQGLAQVLRETPRNRSLALRLLEPLDAPQWTSSDVPAVPAPGQDSPPGGVSLSLEDVSVRAGNHPLLQHLSLSISAGSHVAIVGASGAGKSSLVGLLLGWHPAVEGVVRIAGEPLSPERLTWLRSVTAWVDPSVQLWNRSLLDNLTFGRAPEQPIPLATAVEGADLKGVLERMPEGLQTELGEGGGLVSGGEGQRVRLGRAVMREQVRLVLLDEAFRGLDRTTRHRLLASARQRWAQATLLCVTHDVHEALTFDRVIVLEEGRVIEDGIPSELVKSEQTRFGQLLKVEATMDTVWSSSTWTRIHVEGGQLRVEDGPPAAPRQREAS
ncbi:MAG: ATP-binding cassette domain-containing protein [Hyalangium sp.]|uniref:ATP-binding cassette domain-containing protein n=1 Tax=Hyalangium sp. TaxID=2028555 RepID=UPI00389A2E04